MANSKKNVNENAENTNTAATTAENVNAVSTEVISTPDITESFACLNVNELNAAIEDIANRTTKMSDDEKKYALEIVEDWNTGVVQSINNEHEKLSSFLSSVKDITRSYRTLMTNPDFQAPFTALIEIAGLTDKAKLIGEKIAAADDADREYREISNAPLDIDLELATKMEELDARHKRSKECLIAQNAANKADREKNRIISEFNRALNGNADVKAALSTLAAFDRKLTRSVQTCKTKANQAKLAIAIDDADMRKKLSALINIKIGK